MNHYPRHIGDYLKKTLGLTMLQDGAYNRALDWYYAQERPLPPKPGVYGELRCMTRGDREAVDVVLSRYFTEGPDGYHHGRCDEEIERYASRAETARNNGRNGGRPRNRAGTESDTEPEPSRFAGETKSGTGSKTNQNQNQNQNQKPHGGGMSELPTPETPQLPGTLSPPTWTAWRAHLANLGKPMTPQAERLQLARLAEHPDPEATVRKAIERGHRNLEPAGGYADGKAKQTVHDKRAATAAAIYGNPPEAPNVEPTDITGEARRIA